DWSSDVCSSDLCAPRPAGGGCAAAPPATRWSKFRGALIGPGPSAHGAQSQGSAPEVGGAFTRRCAPRPAGGGCAAVPPAMRVVEPAGVRTRPPSPDAKKRPHQGTFFFASGGEGGIRTPEAL